MEQQLNRETPDDRYKRMCVIMYLYRAGAVSFLDLLNRWEEILADRLAHQRPAAEEEGSNLNQIELMNMNS